MTTGDSEFSLSFRLIRSEQVREMFGGITPMTLWRWIKDQGFPPPFKICVELTQFHGHLIVK
jgi:predicted DNA-binding transcriptional regulator AlpA